MSWISRRQNLVEKLHAMPWIMVTLVVAMALFGTLILISATHADPRYSGLITQRGLHLAIALALLLPVALIPLSIWSHLAFPIYFLALACLLAVAFIGSEAGGAARWLQIGPIRLQPSEFMKIALLLALARIYHRCLQKEGHATLRTHLCALAAIAGPVALIVHQPDLGTALMIAALGGMILFLAGLPARIVLAVAAIGAIAIPAVYFFGLHDYQKQRVLTFLSPSRDPLGAGYQIQQAKIAIGSGGVSGKGYMQGTQSQLEYIPEQHTDFIFTVVAEEFGFIGAIGLLAGWTLAFFLGLAIAARSQSAFGALIAAGASILPGMHVLVNIAMVTGLAPVVGIPLPLISHGGTAILTAIWGLGLIMSAHIHHREIPAH